MTVDDKDQQSATAGSDFGPIAEMTLGLGTKVVEVCHYIWTTSLH